MWVEYLEWISLFYRAHYVMAIQKKEKTKENGINDHVWQLINMEICIQDVYESHSYTYKFNTLIRK